MTLRLPRLQRGTRYVNADGSFTAAFQLFWQKFCEAIEGQEGAQGALISGLAAAVDALQAVTRSDAISASFTAPTEVLTQTDNGSGVTIALVAHNRLYGDGNSVAVTAAPITVPYGPADRGFYYDDPTRDGGAVTLLSTLDLEQAQANFAAGRHALGTLTIIAAGAPPETGGGYRPPGTGQEILP